MLENYYYKNRQVQEIVNSYTVMKGTPYEETIYEIKFKNKSSFYNEQVDLEDLKFYLQYETAPIHQFNLFKNKIDKTIETHLSIPIEQDQPLFPLTKSSKKIKKPPTNGVNNNAQANGIQQLYKFKPSEKLFLTAAKKECLNVSSIEDLIKKIPREIFNPKMHKLFSCPLKGNVWTGEKQSIDEYKEYVFSNRDLLKISPQFNKINVYTIKPMCNQNFRIRTIIGFLQAYFPGVNFEYQSNSISITCNHKNKLQTLQFEDDRTFMQLNYVSHPTCHSKINGCEITSAMERKFFPVKNQNGIYSILTFVDAPIVERYWTAVVSGVDSEVSGSVVSVNMWDKYMPLREIITTAIHEILHIFSMVHCSEWDCVMNYCYEHSLNNEQGGQMMVCPLCLLKLDFQLGGIDHELRYNNLLRQCQKLGFKQDIEWLQKIISFLENQSQRRRKPI